MMETQFKGDVEFSRKCRMQYIDFTLRRGRDENAKFHTFSLCITSCEETKRAGPIQISAVLKILSNKITLTCKEACVTIHTRIHVRVLTNDQEITVFDKM